MNIRNYDVKPTHVKGSSIITEGLFPMIGAVDPQSQNFFKLLLPISPPCPSHKCNVLLD